MGMEDHRSHSLTYILQAAGFLRADSVLLECVANVVNFPCAQACIDRTCIPPSRCLTYKLSGQFGATGIGVIFYVKTYHALTSQFGTLLHASEPLETLWHLMQLEWFWGAAAWMGSLWTCHLSGSKLRHWLQNFASGRESSYSFTLLGPCEQAMPMWLPSSL